MYLHLGGKTRTPRFLGTSSSIAYALRNKAALALRLDMVADAGVQVGTKAAAGLQRVEGLSLGATLGLLAIAAACLTIAHGWTVATWLINLWR